MTWSQEPAVGVEVEPALVFLFASTSATADELVDVGNHESAQKAVQVPALVSERPPLENSSCGEAGWWQRLHTNQKAEANHTSAARWWVRGLADLVSSPGNSER